MAPIGSGRLGLGKSQPDGTERRSRVVSLLRFRPYLRPHLWRFILMIIFAVAGVATSIVVPLVTRAVIDGPVAHSDRPGLYTLGVAALAIGIIEALVVFGRRWVVSKGTLGTETAVRTDLYAKLQRLPMSFHDRWQSGQLLSRMMNDLSTIRRFISFGAIFLLINIIQIAVVTGLLLNMYWPLGLVVLAAIVPITVMCLKKERELTRLSRKMQDETGDVASSVEESAHGLRVIKSFGRSEHMFKKFDARATQLFDTSYQRIKLLAKFRTFLEVVPSVTVIIVLGLGALAAGRGEVTLGTLVAFITMLLSLVWPIAALGLLLSQAQEAMTAADRIAEIFDEKNEITDGPKKLAQVRGEVKFEGAAFRFPDADTDVLHDLNLTIKPGETVAVVGATGSGKTALTALVPRLYDVTAGRITIDGVDIRDLKLEQVRTIVATAFEDPTLFSMSARENLTLGNPEATEAQVTQAIDVAQAHFVYDLPWGLNTRIGEQGMSLSGGQRQRLALARAVLAQPRVLVLDDTLSALDVHTEALVEEALKRVLVGVTGIVVAHRASTVLLADKVALLSNGTISHVGTHAQLLKTVPEYRELLSADFDTEEELAERDRLELEEAVR
ncbi:ABC transporter ATP-binding protein [Microlunatus speluncae]|uniref:ABC transporter ATP-binding protein n=1 Tax=Microlunatus speluncae TaxID=2594267 RepID=UPI001266458B|nr:ABC transporter ATP-binding protein [Microlunatus speluncae]